MKIYTVMIKRFTAIVLLLSCAMISFAQSKSENQVADAVQQLKKAMIDADSASLMKLSSPNLSYGHSSGKIENQKEFVSAIARGNSDFVTIDLSEQTIKVTGKTAIVRHTFIAATNDGGRPGTVKLHILSVWEKSGRKWRILARQAIRLT
jgi:ketosteroid isomerase-like protein